jgi:outer membrane receptor protein involved in Fe transport
MSYTEGKHEIQFGGQLYHQRHAFYNGQSQEGQFAFTTKYSGDGFSDYLLGYPASVFRAYPLALYGNTAYQWVGFVQDTWRATPDLTLNVGLRYEHNPFFNGINGQTSAFDSSNGKIIVPMHNGQLLDQMLSLRFRCCCRSSATASKVPTVLPPRSRSARPAPDSSHRALASLTTSAEAANS